MSTNDPTKRVRAKLVSPPPPPPRIKSAAPSLQQPVSDASKAMRDALIAAGEFAEISLTKPRASMVKVDRQHARMMDLNKEYILSVLLRETNAERITDILAAYVGFAAQQGYKKGTSK